MVGGYPLWGLQRFRGARRRVRRRRGPWETHHGNGGPWLGRYREPTRRDLRRHIPDGIRLQAVFGPPLIEVARERPIGSGRSRPASGGFVIVELDARGGYAVGDGKQPHVELPQNEDAVSACVDAGRVRRQPRPRGQVLQDEREGMHRRYPGGGLRQRGMRRERAMHVYSMRGRYRLSDQWQRLRRGEPVRERRPRLHG